MGHDDDVMTVTSIEGVVLKDLRGASLAFAQLAEGDRPDDTDSIARGIVALIPECVIGSKGSIAEEVERGFDTGTYPHLGKDIAMSVAESASTTLAAMMLFGSIVPTLVIPTGSRSVALSVPVLCGSVAKIVQTPSGQLLNEVQRKTLALIGV